MSFRRIDQDSYQKETNCIQDQINEDKDKVISALKDYVRIITDVNGIVSKFVIATDKKEQLKCFLLSKDIQCKDVYKHALDIHKQAMKNCREFLSIPCDSYTTDEEASTVIDTIKTFFEPGPFKT